MAEVIRMPRMSDTMEEGNIIGWLKEEGEEIESGDTLAEVETDKATMELDSFVDGVLLHIAIKEGPVPIDAVIAVVGEEGEDWKAALEAAQSEENGNGADTNSSNEDGSSQSSPAGSATPEPVESEMETRVKASPLAKSMAKEAGISLTNVSGSGDGGRIVKKDVEALIEQQKSAPVAQPTPEAAPATPPPALQAPPQPEVQPQPQAKAEPTPEVVPFHFSGSGNNYEDQPVSQMRKVIARRLGESKFSAPHFYLTVEINMENVVTLRKRVNEVAPTKISFNDFVIKAVAVSLRQHPAVNSSWLGDKIRYNKDVNIGVAVAIDEGLMVPVVRFADMKTLSQINTEVKSLAGKAKSRKISTEEMQGNTFTISNLGMFGIEEFTAIINPPDACILAVGGIIDKPIVKDGAVVPGKMMKVTLSCDHRVVDGATGAQFLQTLKATLEDPIRLMV